MSSGHWDVMLHLILLYATASIKNNQVTVEQEAQQLIYNNRSFQILSRFHHIHENSPA
jgi:hypothetical protein